MKNKEPKSPVHSITSKDFKNTSLNAKPLLTVVMPVYNGEKYLSEAIKSVLDQTFDDFEFIIIDDGSTDHSNEIIASCKDKRVQLIKNERNRGIAYCRNVGLQRATGEFLAWVDCDDINIPTRFEKQIAFLKQNELYEVCGTWMTNFGGKKNVTDKLSADPEIIKAKLLFKTALFHPTSMWRLSTIRKHNLSFNEGLPIAEDYDFYFRCSFLFPMTNLQESLYLYRASDTSISKKYKTKEEAHFNIHKVIYFQGLKNLGITADNANYRIHTLIASQKPVEDINDYKESYEWLRKIKEKNHEMQIYNPEALNKVLGEQFLFVSKKASRFGMFTLHFYIKNSYGNFAYGNLLEILKLAIRCTLKYKKF